MLKDLILANRSTRGYDPTVPVPDEDLLKMIDCARLSPSSRNIQPLKYFIANDEESVATLNSLVRFAGYLPELNLPFPGTEPPAFIVICQDLSIDPSDTVFLKDVGIAAQSITLAAAEMGYGACMIGNYPLAITRDRLGLGPDMAVRLVISIGRPAETIRLTELEEGGSCKYYRDGNNVHYVPKRRLEDIILNR